MHRFVVISGCSGGGKSTLLEELAGRGHAVAEEPGRRIVRRVSAGEAGPLPWTDIEGFLRGCVELALADRASAADRPGWVFFDRGLVDAVAGLEGLTGRPDPDRLCETHRYHRRVFVAPPWPEIYVQDAERRHGFEEAVVEYARLIRAYPALGYQVVLLPKVGVAARADFVLATLAA
jgi:predicted ATPase